MADVLEAPSTLCGFEHRRVLTLESGQDDQHHERRPLPHEHDDDRQQRESGSRTRSVRDPTIVEEPVDDPERRVEHLGVPDEPGDHGHDQERGDEQGPNHTPAEETSGRAGSRATVPNRSESNTEETVITTLVQTALPGRTGYRRSGRHSSREPTNSRRRGWYDLPAGEAVPEAEQERHLRHHDGEQQCGEEGEPASPCLSALEPSYLVEPGSWPLFGPARLF